MNPKPQTPPPKLLTVEIPQVKSESTIAAENTVGLRKPEEKSPPPQQTVTESPNVPKEPGEGEVSFYVGSTGTGKTYLALQHWIKRLHVTRYPGIIIDGMGERRNISDLRARLTVRDCNSALAALFREHRHVVWMPKSLDEVELFCEKAVACAQEGHPIIIFMDETSPWMSSHRQPENLMLLLRSHYHTRIECLMTTQYLARDFPPLALNCVQNAYIFRNTSPQALERISQTFPDVDIEAVRKLPDRKFIEVHV